jgi:hypothetical protein
MNRFKIHIAAIVIALATGQACTVFQWESDVEQNGIRFVKVRHDEPSGTIIGRTDQNFKADSFSVEKGWVHFYPDWKLKTFQTAEEVRVGTLVLPTRTWLTLDSVGQVKVGVLSDNQEIQGIICRGGGGVSGIQTAFYPSGRLKSCYPAENIRIDGIPCSSNIFVPVCLYENGKLRSCRLSGSVTQAGNTFNSGQEIEVGPDGSIRLFN